MLTQIIKGEKYIQIKFHGNVKHLVFACNECSTEFIKPESYFRKQSKTRKYACCFCSPKCRSKYLFEHRTSVSAPFINKVETKIEETTPKQEVVEPKPEIKVEIQDIKQEIKEVKSQKVEELPKIVEDKQPDAVVKTVTESEVKVEEKKEPVTVQNTVDEKKVDVVSHHEEKKEVESQVKKDDVTHEDPPAKPSDSVKKGGFFSNFLKNLLTDN